MNRPVPPGSTAEGTAQALASGADGPPSERPSGAPADRQPAGRTCILVLGMHRSGTSALTRVISLLGAALPKNILGPNPANPTGHWEPIRLIALHEKMLAEAGSSWDDWRPFDIGELGQSRATQFRAEIASLLEDEFGESPLFVLKEPRISRFVPLYSELLPAMGITPVYVNTFRNPLAIMQSLASRDDFTGAFSSLLWLRHELESERATRGSPRVFVAYEELIADWRAVLANIDGTINVSWPRPLPQAAEQIGSYLSHEHQHHQATGERLQADGRVSQWVKDAYLALKALRSNPDDTQAAEVLDRIRTEFDAASSAVGGALYEELRRRGQAGDHLIAQARSERDELQRQLVEWDSYATHAAAREQNLEEIRRDLAAKLEASESALANLARATDARIAELLGDRGKLQEQLDASRSDLSQLAAATDSRIAELLGAEQDLRQVVAARDIETIRLNAASDARIKDLVDERQRLQALVEDKTQALTRLAANTDARIASLLDEIEKQRALLSEKEQALANLAAATDLRIEELVASQLRLQEVLDGRERDIAELADATDRRIAELLSDRLDFERKIEQVSAELREVNERAVEQHRRLGDFQQELLSRQEDYRSELDRLRTTLADRQLLLEQRTAEASSLAEDLARVRGERDFQQAALLSAEAEVDALRDQLSALSQERRLLTEALAESGELGQRQTAALGAAVETHKSEVGSLSAELDALRTELEHNRKERSVEQIDRTAMQSLLDARSSELSRLVLTKGPATRRGGIPIKLVELHHLALNEVRGITSEWVMSGNDPQFEVKLLRGNTFAIGYYVFSLRLPGGTGQMVMPKIYYDAGAGFNEGDSQALDFRDMGGGWYASRMKLPKGARQIRFDPSTAPGAFSISGVHLKRIGQLRFYWPAARDLLRQRMKSTGGVRRTATATLRAYRSGGVAGIRNRVRDLLLNKVQAFQPNIVVPTSRYAEWVRLNTPGTKLRNDLERRIRSADPARLPMISVVCPVYNTDHRLLREAVASVIHQAYVDWELILVDDGSSHRKTKETLEAIGALDSRIRIDRMAVNGGISAATNRGVELASGDVIALLDHDDLLTEDALAEVALCYAADPNVDFVYSDDDKIDMSGHRYEPQFKPGWSPTLLLNYMYISHLMTFRRHLYLEVGGCRSQFDGTQDHDLALRITERARKVIHIPKVLYHWRSAPGSIAASAGAKPLAAERGRLCVSEAFARRSIGVEDVVQPQWAAASGLGIYAPIFPDDGPLVTILIPSRNNLACLQRCVESLSKTKYKSYEIIVIDNSSDDPRTLGYLSEISEQNNIRVISVESPITGFSFSRVNNVGASHASGEYILFLNDDTEVSEPAWLSQMVGYLQMDGVGTVGARLHYPDGTIQHGGVVRGFHNGLAGHAFRHSPRSSTGYLWYLRVAREYSAVTAACMLTRATTFAELGGFDETDFAVAFNDVDFCMRVARRGLRNVYCGQAELIHYEGRSRPRRDNPSEVVAYRRIYGRASDPFYNPNLSLEEESFSIRPRSSTLASSPVVAVMVSHDLALEGAPKCMFDLVCGLRDRGYVIPRIVSPKDGPLRAEYEKAGIAVEIIPFNLSPAGDLEQAILPLRSFARDVGANLIYANTLVMFWAIAAAAREGLPSLWNPRESFPPETYFDHLPPKVRAEAYNCFGYPYKVLFVSNASREVWRRFDSGYRFEVITDSLRDQDMEAWIAQADRSGCRSRLGLDHDTLCFVALGTVWDHKGQLDIVKALRGLDPAVLEKIAIFIVGDRPGAYSEAIRSYMSSSLTPMECSRVHLISATDRPYEYLAAADVALCCSRVDTFPRVILEYMAFGLPIITTPVYGIAEQVQPEVNAKIYQPDDISMLRAHINAMVMDPGERRRLAANSRLVLGCLPDFDAMLDRYEEVFREAALAPGEVDGVAS